MTKSHDTELKEPIYWVLYLETLLVQFVAHASLQMSTPLLCYVKVAEILGFIKPATPYSFSSFSVDLASNESWRCEPSYKDRSNRPFSTCGAESLTGMKCPYCPKLAGSLKRIPFGSWHHPYFSDFASLHAKANCDKGVVCCCLRCSAAAHPHCAFSKTCSLEAGLLFALNQLCSQTYIRSRLFNLIAAPAFTFGHEDDQCNLRALLQISMQIHFTVQIITCLYYKLCKYWSRCSPLLSAKKKSKRSTPRLESSLPYGRFEGLLFAWSKNAS